MTLILKKEHSKLIYRVSFLSLVTSSYGFYQGHVVAVFPACVFLTSVNYWREPKLHSWQRKLDIVVVNVSVLSNYYLMYDAEYAKICYCISILGLACYPIEKYFYYRNQHLITTYLHILLHILLNTSLIILYSGYIFKTETQTVFQPHTQSPPQPLLE